jgi:hypothetical protein
MPMPSLQQTTSQRLPAYGQANQAQVTAQKQSCPFCADPVTAARKGRLYLLATPDAPRELLALFADRYYADLSFDFVPSLRAALAHAYVADHGYQGRILAALIVHELSMYAVATDEGEAYLMRADQIIRPLSEHAMTCEVCVPVDDDPQEQVPMCLRSVKCRLLWGDTIVLGPSRWDQLITRGLQQSSRHSGDPQTLASRLASKLRGRVKARHPFVVVAMPRLSPVARVGPIARPQRLNLPDPPPPVVPAMPSRRERSPIWLALAFAAVALAFSVWMRQPQISAGYLGEIVMTMLTPTPEVSSSGGGAQVLDPRPEATPVAGEDGPGDGATPQGTTPGP